MKKKLVLLSALAALGLLAGGCSSMHTSGKNVPQSPWTDFAAAKTAFDQIVPGQTTPEALRALGFDPYVNPNVRILNYLDLQNRFLPQPSVRLEDLPGPVRQALAAKEQSLAYELDLTVLRTKRYGNLLLDMLAFNRKTHETGWNFKALIVLKQDQIVYKLWSGQPQVERHDQKKRPLGPFQELDGAAGFSVMR